MTIYDPMFVFIGCEELVKFQCDDNHRNQRTY